MWTVNLVLTWFWALLVLPRGGFSSRRHFNKGHLTHETESLWPLQFKHSHWWKRRNRSTFASDHAWGINGVCECKMDVMSTWIPTWHRMDHVSWSPGLFFKNHVLEVDPTQNRETMALRMLTTVDLVCFIMCEDPAWISIHWNSICLRVRSHMTSHYTWGSVTTLYDFRGVLGHRLDTFFWALTI